MKITMKDIVSINKEYDEGTVINEGSLSFALESIKKSQDWLEQISYIVRALLLDHVFQDGNKRTAAKIIMAALEREGFEFDEEEIIKLTIRLSKSGLNDVKDIKKEIALAIY